MKNLWTKRLVTKVDDASSVSYLDWTPLLTPNWWHICFNSMWWVVHGVLVASLMIFGLVTFTKVKLHPPSFIMRSIIHWVMTRLIFMHEVSILGGGNLGELGGGMSLAMRCRPTCIVGILQWINNLATFYLNTCDHFRDMIQPILTFNLIFIAKWPM